MSEGAWLLPSNAIPIRQLNDQGIERFRAYLEEVKAGATDPLPIDLLQDDSQARILDRHLAVGQKSFDTTLDITNYLHPRIDALRLPGKYYDPGLWAWLTAFYFDLVCPANVFGQRKVGELARYIPPRNRNFNESNRHLLAVPVRLYDQHGEERIKLLMSSPPYEQTLALNLISRSQEFSTNPGILDAVTRLYWDEKNQRPKRGYSSTDKPGALRRFIAVMNQFNRTFDLFAMAGEQIIDLLPEDEFGRWMPSFK